MNYYFDSHASLDVKGINTIIYDLEPDVEIKCPIAKTLTKTTYLSGTNVTFFNSITLKLRNLLRYKSVGKVYRVNCACTIPQERFLKIK